MTEPVSLLGAVCGEEVLISWLARHQSLPVALPDHTVPTLSRACHADLKVFAMTGASNGSGGLACVRSSRGGLILMAQAF